MFKVDLNNIDRVNYAQTCQVSIKNETAKNRFFKESVGQNETAKNRFFEGSVGHVFRKNWFSNLIDKIKEKLKIKPKNNQTPESPQPQPQTPESSQPQPQIPESSQPQPQIPEPSQPQTQPVTDENKPQTPGMEKKQENNSHLELSTPKKTQTENNKLFELAKNLDTDSETITAAFNEISQDQLPNFLKATDENGQTSLHNSAISRNITFLQALLNYTDIELLVELLEINDNDGETALIHAARTNEEEADEAAEEFLKTLAHGFENSETQLLQFLQKPDKNGNIPLYELPKYEKGADFMRAAFEVLGEEHREPFLKLSKKTGKGKYKKSPIKVAMARNNTAYLAAIAEQLKDPTEMKIYFPSGQLNDIVLKEDVSKLTFLHWTSMYGQEKGVKCLQNVFEILGTKNGLMFSVFKRKDKEGNTILHTAVNCDNIEFINVTIKYLGQKRIQPLLEIINDEGETLLGIAERKNYDHHIMALFEIFKNHPNELLKFLEKPNENGIYPLCEAASKTAGEILVNIVIEQIDNDKFLPLFEKPIQVAMENKKTSFLAAITAALTPEQFTIVFPNVQSFSAAKDFLEMQDDSNQSTLQWIAYLTTVKNGERALRNIFKALPKDEKENPLEWLLELLQKKINKDTPLDYAAYSDNEDFFGAVIDLYNSDRKLQKKIIQAIRMTCKKNKKNDLAKRVFIKRRKNQEKSTAENVMERTVDESQEEQQKVAIENEESHMVPENPKNQEKSTAENVMERTVDESQEEQKEVANENEEPHMVPETSEKQKELTEESESSKETSF